MEGRRRATPSELGRAWHPKEQEWLAQFRAWLVANHARTITDIIVYGSKARGDWNEDSDIDVLLIVKADAEHIQKELRDKGYDLADHSAMLPSILTRTEEEWAARGANGLLFHEQVERDGVSVL